MEALTATSRVAADPLRRLWGPVTIRVAWDLLRAGVQVRAATLRAARDHALWRLPPGAGLAEAEAVTTQAVEEYLARCAGRYAPFELDPDLGILPTPAWRDAILDASEPIHEAILRLHYADGLAIEEVSRRTRLEVALLRGAREAVRALGREVMVEDGAPVNDWDPARLDRLLVRTATAAGDLCPGPGGLATEAGRAHADTCPRCSRALRMLREGVLSPGDLFPPEDGACLPSTTADVACIGVHPNARRHLRSLAKAFGPHARLAQDDILLVDAREAPLDTLLRDAAERGAPAASQLRVIRGVVLGRWVPRALVGPGVDRLLARLRGAAWGEHEGVAPLPEPLPPPPSAARWWAASAVAALLAAVVGAWTLGGPGPEPAVPLQVTKAGDGLLFDTADDAFVDLVAVRAGGPTVVFHSVSPADKGRMATGDGRYHLRDDAAAFVAIASDDPIEGLDRVLEVLPSGGERPLEVMIERLRERYPDAAVLAAP
jgi:hypothetical protein